MTQSLIYQAKTGLDWNCTKVSEAYKRFTQASKEEDVVCESAASYKSAAVVSVGLCEGK